jgi:hypothetical protein
MPRAEATVHRAAVRRSMPHPRFPSPSSFAMP